MRSIAPLNPPLNLEETWVIRQYRQCHAEAQVTINNLLEYFVCRARPPAARARRGRGLKAVLALLGF